MIWFLSIQIFLTLMTSNLENQMGNKVIENRTFSDGLGQIRTHE